jgi:hypothetical protein
LLQISFFDAAAAVSKIGSNLKPNHHYELNQVKLSQILETRSSVFHNFWQVKFAHDGSSQVCYSKNEALS